MPKGIVSLFMFVSVVVLITACVNEVSESNPQEGVELETIPEHSINACFFERDTVLNLPCANGYRNVQILVPKGQPKGVLIGFQGWNFPITSWCDSTDICMEALSHGFVLVFPDMGKSIFSLNHYVETRKDWLDNPTRSWLQDTLIPVFQNDYNMFLEGDNSFVFGLSTGGRGAFLLAKEFPEIFKGAATLSGDFDQTKYPEDNLYRGFYGEYSEQATRWSQDENPIYGIDSFNVPLFIAHGGKDKVVPVEHSDDLMKHLTGEVHYVRDETSGHDYAFWSSQTSSVLQFFLKHCD